MNKYLLIAALVGSALLPAAASATAPQPQMCYDLYQPVCGSHQVQCFAAPCYPVYETYSNSCFAESANATVIHDGVCTEAETGPIKPTLAPYTPPAGCVAWFDGCNSCGKNGTGAICTQMACVGPTKAGYCTAYAAATTTPVTHPHPATTTPPVVTASTTATTSLPSFPMHGLFFRLWHWFFGWK